MLKASNKFLQQTRQVARWLGADGFAHYAFFGELDRVGLTGCHSVGACGVHGWAGCGVAVRLRWICSPPEGCAFRCQ